MEITFCPFLGLQDDAETHMTFPSERNCCRHANPIQAISLYQQSAHCLSEAYIDCPVFNSDNDINLPPDLQAFAPSQRSKNHAGIIFMALLIPIALLVIWWQSGLKAFNTNPVRPGLYTKGSMGASVIPARTVFMAIPNLNTGHDAYTSTTTLPVIETTIIIYTATFTQASLPLFTTKTQSVYPTSSPTHCIPPGGWVLYSVQPNDNLYRLSMTFGVTIEDLQKANCMGTSTLIRIGQSFYVPNNPTKTSLMTTSVTPTIPNPTETSTPEPSTPTVTKVTVTLTDTPTLIPTISTPYPPPLP